MLMISGVTLVILVLLVAAIASRMFQSPTISPAVRSFLGSAVFSVLLSSIGGVGVTMLMLFLEQPSGGAIGGIEEGVSAAIVVGGLFVVRLLQRRGAAVEEAA